MLTRLHSPLALAPLVLLVVLLPGICLAQPPSPRWTAGTTIGAGRTWDDEGHIGDGPLAGGHAAWRWLEKTDIELSLDYLRHRRSGGYFEADGHTTLAGASIVQRFGNDAASAFVVAGPVLVFHSGTAGFPADGRMTRSKGTEAGLAAGAGMVFGAGRRIELGPIVKVLLLSPRSDAEPAFAIMGGIRVASRR